MKNLALALASDAFIGGDQMTPGNSLIASGYYDDQLGTLELGAAYLGAARRQAPRQMRMVQPAAVPRQTLVPATPGAPEHGLRLEPLGLGASAFTATSGLILNLQASPQKAFKPQRLIIDVTRTGATATGLVTVNRIDIGAVNAMVGSNPLPVSMFGSTSVDCNLAFAPATPGIQVTVQVACSLAPTAPDRIDFSGAMIGTAFGG